MTRTIAAVSLKGGSGKTSLVQNVAYELAQMGQRCLLLDLDQQANLTIGCGVDPGQGRPPIYAALDEPTTSAPITVGDNLDLLASNLDLAEAEIRFGAHPDRNLKVRAIIKTIGDRYDYVWIDCPPGLDFYTVNALSAATEAIIPLQCHFYAYRMIDPVLSIIERAKTINEALRLSAIVPTMFDSRNSLSVAVVEAARERFGDLVTQTVIPINVRIADAPMHGLPVAKHDPRSTGAQAFKELATEIHHGQKK
ncbi:MAG: ParA family protein [Caldilineaceae bacterium]|nr:ParA family protein [Caldilineaceae bacterium]